MSDEVLYETRGRVAHVTLNRPKARNAIDPETSSLLREAFDAFAGDDELCAAVLSGAGNTFSASADLKAAAAGATPAPQCAVRRYHP